MPKNHCFQFRVPFRDSKGPFPKYSPSLRVQKRFHTMYLLNTTLTQDIDIDERKKIADGFTHI